MGGRVDGRPEERTSMVYGEAGRSDLGGFTLDSLQHGVVGRVAEPALAAGLCVLVAHVAGAESLGAIVEGVAERLVDTLDGVPASHEDLYMLLVFRRRQGWSTNSLKRSGTCAGMGCNENWFLRHVDGVNWTIRSG